ncbi:hypothetical protein [Blastococcus tunisiensis]|uniref:Uncharacterized protein n=1 Tax=Blastococcus tunisiensis TaxID=1798228 RepID=A0A1I2I668_9ACTN|nr:hypothetical protein [Blastococcus sp. DSM 46838]SFF37138.1 hypothetical protein SAMN05216574_11297 [Blastococcus sp. DSM 46838]
MTVGERLGWGAAAVVVATWLALVEVFWLPLRAGGVLVPVSVLAAVVGNLLLPVAALRLSGSRLVALLPALAWLVVAVGAMLRRPEGDLVMTGAGDLGVLNLVFLMLGVLAAAVSVGRVLGGSRRPVAPARSAPAAGPARTTAGQPGVG